MLTELSKFAGLAENDEYEADQTQPYKQDQRDDPLPGRVHTGAPAQHERRQDEKEYRPGLEQDRSDCDVNEFERPRKEGVFAVAQDGEQDPPVYEIAWDFPLEQGNPQFVNTQMQTDYRRSPVDRFSIRGGKVVPESAPVVPVEPQGHVESEQYGDTANGNARPPGTHEKERQLFAANIADHSWDDRVGNHRDENEAQRDAIVP